MFMQQDWLMRQIEIMTMAIGQLLFGKDSKEHGLKEELKQEQSAELKQKLDALFKEGRLGEAEDLLFFELDETDISMLAVAIDFYQQANTMSDDELNARGFTRSELWEGLGEVVERYGVLIPGFWDKKTDFLDHSWVKAPKKWIDPAKESTADKTALQSGQKTFQDLCAERGKDWKEAVQEMAEVLRYGRENGIEMGGVIFGNGTTAQQQQPKTDPPAGE